MSNILLTFFDKQHFGSGCLFQNWEPFYIRHSCCFSIELSFSFDRKFVINWTWAQKSPKIAFDPLWLQENLINYKKESCVKKTNRISSQNSQTRANDHLATTTTILWSLYGITILLNNNHLSTTATIVRSRGWSLYTCMYKGLTVSLILHNNSMKTYIVIMNIERYFLNHRHLKNRFFGIISSSSSCNEVKIW